MEQYFNPLSDFGFTDLETNLNALTGVESNLSEAATFLTDQNFLVNDMLISNELTTLSTIITRFTEQQIDQQQDMVK